MNWADVNDPEPSTAKQTLTVWQSDIIGEGDAVALAVREGMAGEGVAVAVAVRVGTEVTGGVMLGEDVIVEVDVGVAVTVDVVLGDGVGGTDKLADGVGDGKVAISHKLMTTFCTACANVLGSIVSKTANSAG